MNTSGNTPKGVDGVYWWRERVASGKEMAWGLERKLLGKKYQGGFPTVCGLQL